MSGLAGAAWVSWAFASMFAALALFYGIRCSAGTQRDVDVSRGVMSLGMVVMLVPSLDPFPRLVWQSLFGLVALHLTGRLVQHRRSVRNLTDPLPERDGHRELHLVIGALAMVYMFSMMPAGHDMAHEMSMAVGSTALAIPLLSWALIGYFLVFAVRLSARLAVPVGAAAPRARNLVVSPHLLGSSEVVMGIGMSYMLITML